MFKKIGLIVASAAIVVGVPLGMTKIGFVLENHAASHAAQWKEVNARCTSSNIIWLTNGQAGSSVSYSLDNHTFNGYVDTEGMDMAVGNIDQIYANNKGQIYDYGIKSPSVTYNRGWIVVIIIISTIAIILAIWITVEIWQNIDRENQKRQGEKAYRQSLGK